MSKTITEKVYLFFKRNGWTQKVLYDDGCFCLSGAAAMVVGGFDIDTELCNKKAENAGVRLAKELGFANIGHMESWNDAPLRTKEEVLDLLRDVLSRQTKRKKAA